MGASLVDNLSSRRFGQYVLQNEPGLEVTITGALGLRVGYQVRYTTDVAPGSEKTDTLTTIGLLYETK